MKPTSRKRSLTRQGLEMMIFVFIVFGLLFALASSGPVYTDITTNVISDVTAVCLGAVLMVLYGLAVFVKAPFNKNDLAGISAGLAGLFVALCLAFLSEFSYAVALPLIGDLVILFVIGVLAFAYKGDFSHKVKLTKTSSLVRFALVEFGLTVVGLLVLFNIIV